jgi:hypothetical protein
MLQPAYIRARKALVERGWLKVENRHIYLLLDDIRAQGTTSHCVSTSSTTSDPSKTQHQIVSAQYHDVPQAQHHDVHNIKENKNNKKEIEKEPIILESGTWIEKFNAIHNHNTDWGKEAVSLLKNFTPEEARRVVLLLQDKYNIIFK